MDLRIVTDTADRFVVQGWHAQTGEAWMVVGGFGLALLLCFNVWKQGGWGRRLGWGLAGGAALVFVWFVASIWTTGGIRFDVEIDKARGTWTTEAVYPKEPGEYDEPPVTRALTDVLRVDLVGSPGKGGGEVNSQRILVTLRDGTTFEPFEGEERGAAKEFLVLDRMQKMLVGAPGEGR